jgi:hypothetical protein
MSDAATPVVFNPFQRLCSAVYADGDFSDVSTIAGAKEVGDSLFAYLMRELSDTEDCESPSDAMNRIKATLRDVQSVLDAIESVEDGTATVSQIIPGLSAHQALAFTNEWERRRAL